MQAGRSQASGVRDWQVEPAQACGVGKDVDPTISSIARTEADARELVGELRGRVVLMWLAVVAVSALSAI
jgi:hypothetical protein